MFPTVRFVNGHWFAYCEDRILGPFKFEKQAWNAIAEYNKENSNARYS